MRPKSIVQFEIVYLVSIALRALVAILSFDVARAAIAGNPAITANPGAGAFAEATLYGVAAFSVIIGLLLWYFAARAHNVVAKWIIVVFFAFGVLGVLAGIVMRTMPPGIIGVLGIVVFVLNAIGVWLLFKPDALVWFGERQPVTVTDDGDHIA